MKIVISLVSILAASVVAFGSAYSSSLSTDDVEPSSCCVSSESCEACGENCEECCKSCEECCKNCEECENCEECCLICKECCDNCEECCGGGSCDSKSSKTGSVSEAGCCQSTQAAQPVKESETASTSSCCASGSAGCCSK